MVKIVSIKEYEGHVQCTAGTKYLDKCYANLLSSSCENEVARLKSTQFRNDDIQYLHTTQAYLFSNELIIINYSYMLNVFFFNPM